MSEIPSRGRPVARRWAGRLMVVVAVAAVAVIGWGSPARAHATLLETSPAGDAVVAAVPSAVELVYSEAVDVGSGGVEVFGPDGDRVDRGSVEMSEDELVVSVPIDDGGEGTYTVAWRVTSEDGHTINGSFVFHVGEETGAVEVDQSTPLSVEAAGFAGRWLAFAGMLVLVGAVLVGRLAASDREVGLRMRRLARVAAASATVGAALALLAATAESTGRSLGGAVGVVGDFVSDQRTGELGALRVGLLLVAVLAVGLLRDRVAAAVVGVVVAGAMVTTALAGHAWTTTTPRLLTVSVDVVHQGAVAVWVGGVVALLVGLGAATDRGPLSRRFSNVALVTVVVTAVTGTVSAWAQIRSWDALFDTGYGRLVVAKVVGFALLVALGALNRQRLVALVEHSILPLARSLTGEVAVGVLVLGVTAGLVAQQPARLVVDSGPVEVSAQEADMTLDLVVDPARVGTNDIHLYFYDAEGTEPVIVYSVEIEAAIDDIPPRRLEVTPMTTSHVSALEASLSTPGTWTITVTAVGDAGTPVTFSLEVPVR